MRTLRLKLWSSSDSGYLDQLIDISGIIWNECLSITRRHYDETKKLLPKSELSRMLPDLKKANPFWSLVNSQAIQQIIDRIYLAYDQFFRKRKDGRKASPPKYRKVKKYRSFTLKQTGYKVRTGGRIRIGRCIYRYHDSYDGLLERVDKIHTITVKRNALGEFFIYAVIDSGATMVESRGDRDAVGMDFGLRAFLTLSDGTRIESPRFYWKDIREIRKACKEVSRKEKGSGNWWRAMKALCRRHDDISNRRRDWFWKTAHGLCSRYSIICLEDLDLRGMAKLWGRKVHDIAFGEFVEILQQCARKHGTELVFVDRFYASSRTCSECGGYNDALMLKDRSFVCPRCTHVEDRDTNAAKNILREGLRLLSQKGDTA